jgi:molybdopterin-guanine dinucleotide biosynthesis protein A
MCTYISETAPPKRMDFASVILAGGRSRRFGQDKALFRPDSDGPTLIELVHDRLMLLGAPILIVGPDRFADLDLDATIVPDDRLDLGPLSGIATAFRHLYQDRILVAGCDMPCLSTALLRRLLDLTTSVDLVACRTSDGRVHPFPGVYRRSILRIVEHVLEGSDRSIRRLLPHIRLETIGESDLRQLDPELDSLMSVNWPADAERARRCAERRKLDTVRSNSPSGGLDLPPRSPAKR